MSPNPVGDLRAYPVVPHGQDDGTTVACPRMFAAGSGCARPHLHLERATTSSRWSGCQHLALAFVATWLAACAEPAPVPTVPAATTPPRPVIFDIGSNDPRLDLLDGWSVAEAANDIRWVWAVDRRARLAFEVDEPAADRLGLRGRALAGAAPQQIRVALNGRSVGVLSLTRGGAWNTYWLELPADTLQAGRNELTLGFRTLQSPHDLDPTSEDRRTLAAAITGLHLAVGPPAETSSSRFFDDADQPVQHIRIGDETREALVATPSRPLRRRWSVEAGTRLEVAAGIRCPTRSPCAGRFRFIVKADDEIVWTTTSDGARSAWSPGDVDLGAVADRTVDLSFDVESLVPSSDDGGDAIGEPFGTPIWAEPLPTGSGPSDRLNVILVSIDTLRADRLGSYGYSRPTSPHLDGLAAEGVRFDQAISQAPWTTPSHMSLFTSTYPSVHGVNQGWTELLDHMLGETRYRSLSTSIPTLAEVLRDHGYRTVAVAGGTTVSAKLGFARGFDRYREDHSRGFEHLTPEAESATLDMLERYQDQPFFFFFHTFEVHAPYIRGQLADMLDADQRAALEAMVAAGTTDPLGDFRSFLDRHHLMRADVTSALYDGGIQYTDAFLGRLFARLDALGLRERTLIVVTSDHGEEFADHSDKRFLDAHCNTVYDELIRVPLILRLPNRLPAGHVVTEQVELIDVAPTVLDLLNLPRPTTMQGRSLRQPIDTSVVSEPVSGMARGALSEATCVSPELKSLRMDGFKYIYAFPTPDGERIGVGAEPTWEALFDLVNDPGEHDNLAAGNPERLAEWRSRLIRRFAELPSNATPGTDAVEVEVDDELIERLRALGYLD